MVAKSLAVHVMRNRIREKAEKMVSLTLLSFVERRLPAARRHGRSTGGIGNCR